jgi:ribosomal protein S14
MFSSPIRQIPIVQVYASAQIWTTRTRQYRLTYRFQHRTCWITKRGRSVTRLTGLARGQFRLLALKGWCWGLQRSSW